MLWRSTAVAAVFPSDCLETIPYFPQKGWRMLPLPLWLSGKTDLMRLNHMRLIHSHSFMIFLLEPLFSVRFFARLADHPVDVA